MKRRILLLSSCAFGLTSCTSTLVHNWQIAAIPGTVRNGTGIQVGVRSIGLPSAMSQTGIPAPGSAYTADTFPNDLWSAQLSGMLQIVMVQDLSQRLPVDTFLADGGGIGKTPDQWVEIQILEFLPNRDGNVFLSAQLATRPLTSHNWQFKSFQASAAGGDTAEKIVAAMSTLWGQAADYVADMLSSELSKN